MRASASGLALLHSCGYSFREDVALPPSVASDESKRGNAFALLAEGAVNGQPVNIDEAVKGLSDAEETRLRKMWGHAFRWLAEHKRLGWRAEQPFAYDPVTDVGRELPRTTHRDYTGATPTELCGTADLVYIEGESVVIPDWKTTVDGAPDVDARDQLEGLALMAARAWGYDSARIITLIVTESGVEEVEGEPLDVFSLVDVRDRIRADLARVPTAEPEPGPHCTLRYCSALAVCPKTQEAIVPLVPVDALTAKRYAFSPVIESPDHLAWLLEKRKIVRKAMEQIDGAVEGYVAAGPVHTSEGDEIRQAFRTMPRMNQSALLELAKQKGATDDEISACIRPSIEGNGVRLYKGKKAKAA